MYQRRKIHNILEDMKGKIRVFCRVRPMVTYEINNKSLPVVTLVDQFQVKLQYKESENQSYKDKEFNFDACFGAKAT